MTQGEGHTCVDTGPRLMTQGDGHRPIIGNHTTQQSPHRIINQPSQDLTVGLEVLFSKEGLSSYYQVTSKKGVTCSLSTLRKSCLIPGTCGQGILFPPLEQVQQGNAGTVKAQEIKIRLDLRLSSQW